MLRPRARPDDVKPVSGGSTKERSGGGGGGKGGDMATSREQIDRSMNDKRFGYYDPYTGKKVSALIDMINGGGMNAAGSDFEGGPYSGILNAIGVTPYGQENVRSGMPEGSWRGGEIDDARRYSGFGGPTVSAMPAGGVSDMRPRARPEMSFGNTPVGGGMPAAMPMMFGNTPVGGGMPAAAPDMLFGDVPVGSMPAAPTQMVRPEGPAAGMPRALPSMVRPEGPAAGMPAAPTQMVRPEGPAAGMPQAPVQRYADPTQDPLFMQYMARQVSPETFESLYMGRSGERALQRQYEAYLSFMMAKERRG